MTPRYSMRGVVLPKLFLINRKHVSVPYSHGILFELTLTEQKYAPLYLTERGLCVDE